ncbi:MAG: sensor histidine kinase [Eubacterium sp.]|nr:sensor histidine kinase [Eubacterium sp.]
MARIRKEKSIIGKVDSMSQKLVIMLVFPIFVSLVLMLVYAGRYHNAIKRMETIANLKAVVSEEIPESVWAIVSGRETVVESKVYASIHEVHETIGEIMERADDEDRLSLVVADRTMQTLENYVNQIRDNIEAGRPVVENEEVMNEIRDVASLVDSMMNEYIAREINSTANRSATLRFLILITAVAEGIIVVLAWLLRNRSMKRAAAFVRQPIDRLEEVAAKLAEGTLDARLNETEVAELRNLTHQVNIMADRLEEMMDKSHQDERNLRKAELRTLQTQINPHFLYNTLDAIIWKAEAGEKDEVIQLTNALSNFFRISLSSGADWIPIRQERKHIEGYLTIQQTRYRDIMRYEIDIPEDIGEYYILKLLLQPLVENALYHGIKIKRGGGTIRVAGRLVDDMLEFSVSDTGTGMTAEQLRNLKERMMKGQPSVSEGAGGFGLVNVNLRIRLYYNQPEGLRIISDEKGTTVSFRVPCRTREEISENESIPG